MNTLSLLFAHCGKPLPPPFEVCVFNHPCIMSSLIWAFVVLVLGIVVAYLVYYYFKSKNETKQAVAEAARKHELELKKKAFEFEEQWFDKNKQAKDDELARKIKEYNELRR